MIPVVFFIGFVSVTAQIIDWESQQSVDRLLRRIYTQDERLGRIEERYNELTEKANHRIDIRKNAGNEAKRLMNVHVSDTMTGTYTCPHHYLDRPYILQKEYFERMYRPTSAINKLCLRGNV